MGTFKQSCPYCGTRIEVDDIYAGKKANCPKCGKVIKLNPGTTPQPQPPPPPPPQYSQPQSRSLPPLQSRPVPPQNPYTTGNQGAAPPPPPKGTPSLAEMTARYGGNVGLAILFYCLRWLWDFLMFRRMIYRIWAIFVNFIVSIGGIVFAIICFASGASGKGFLTLGILVLYRFLTEWLLVVFAINDTLTSIKNDLATLKK